MVMRIAYTPGEPAGVGLDLVIELAQRRHRFGSEGREQSVELIVVADPELLNARARHLNRPLTLRQWQPNQSPQSTGLGVLAVEPVSTSVPVCLGRPDPGHAPYILETLDRAVDRCRQGDCDAMVTGPVQKSSIIEAGIEFSGHTEYLARRCGVKQVVMMLATPGLKVALATTHIPLSAVASAIEAEHLRSVIEVLHRELSKYSQIEPRLLVCGLNPHAGEGGHLGLEERDIILPVIEDLRRQGLSIIGPLAADTAFTAKTLAQGDAVLCMYHDQGLPVIKYKGFGKTANITLGLPIVRASVDHGTALDLAGSGRAELGSLCTAVNTAVAMVGREPW